jgi:indole-3-glycerol phosphate synthase
MPVSLDQILRSTEGRLDMVRASRAALEQEAHAASTPLSLAGALRRQTVAVIAEVKRRSPSAGSIRDDLDPQGRAELYARHGASAISVLTDGPFFGGSIEDLRVAARAACVPVLLKDFVLDEIQILEARAAGAAAVLLIVRALGGRLAGLLRYSRELGLDALVEVHTEPELGAALEAGATIIGVNSRDLDTFTINLAAALNIVGLIPPDCVGVVESGMSSRADIRRAADAGADAVLVGTALSAAAAPDLLLTELSMVPRRGR